jgi:cytidylate kinase
MCTEKKIVVALYGRSCSGKSTTARELSQLLDCPTYSAGERVKDRSKELSVSPADLSLLEHRLIDESLRAMAQSVAKCLIVEGSFLDVLFYDIRNVNRIELVCSAEERRRRFNQRSGLDNLGERDKNEDDLRRALHGERSCSAEASFDTTSKTPEGVAQEIFRWLEARTSKALG